MFYNIVKIILKPIFHIIFRLEIENKIDLQNKGRLIICANHINLLDPLILAVSTNRQISFIAKKELFENKFFAYILRSFNAIPVDRDNIDLKAIKSSVKILKEDKILGIFPEGTRVKEVSFDNIKNGISYIALKGDADILPIQIQGKYGLFKKIKVVYKDIIQISQYEDLSKSEKYQQIALDVYKSIYDIK